MKLFFDCEFTGLRQNTTPISIGIVSEDGKKFYAEFTDYDESQCNDWITENVTSELLHDTEKWYEGIADRQIHGIKKIISYALKDWIQQFKTIQFASDVCHYDFILLIDLLTNGGTALDLPKNISAACHDINQDIAKHFNISDREAFDMSREKIMNDLCKTEDIVTGNKHNSLYDAEVIKAIYEEIGYDI